MGSRVRSYEIGFFQRDCRSDRRSRVNARPRATGDLLVPLVSLQKSANFIAPSVLDRTMSIGVVCHRPSLRDRMVREFPVGRALSVSFAGRRDVLELWLSRGALPLGRVSMA